MKIIARVYTDFKEKFGIPRQSGIIKEARGYIVFEKEYSVTEAVRGLEDFSHIWILWQFSESARKDWSPTVRPPKLGGNKRVGVFATRAPFRPNSIGLSCVELEKIEHTDNGPVLHIKGADILDNTPVFDIKPYLPYTDSHPDAKAGFTEHISGKKLFVDTNDEKLSGISDEIRNEIVCILSDDPRPAYHNDERIYGFKYNDFEIKFKVVNDTVSIVSIEKSDFGEGCYEN